jgi:peptide/nickel transport system ATP-binding protein
MSTFQEPTERVESDEPLLTVDSLDVEFAVKGGSIKALRDVSMTLEKGETLGIAGESGSGKSTLALAILQYLDNNARVPNGSIEFKGKDLLNLSDSELLGLRGNKIAHVAQNATTSLNPSMRIGAQIKEAVTRYQDVSSKQEAMARVYEVLKQVNIPDPEEIAKRYPSELSGGQQQRALIAIALSCQPELLIMDEPTTGLDVTTQAKLLDLIEELKAEFDIGIMLITHNLSVIAQIADRVNILYAGEMMEKGPVDDVFTNPANPYTQALLATTPELEKHKQLRQIPGQIPALRSVPDGCVFADRCAFATEECRTGSIPMESVSDDHETRCHRWEAVLDEPIQSEEVPRRRSNPGEPILETENLVKHYDEGTFVQNLIGNHEPVQAVQGVDIEIREGETLGLVGESGCGKSTLGRTLLGLHEVTDGVIKYRGKPLKSLSKQEHKEFHGECQIIFQDPEASLNPRKTIRSIIDWPLQKFTDLDKEGRNQRLGDLLDQVNLNVDVKTKYPHELSGGQQQRVSIARAFAADPSLVVLDEPVSSLDVSVQASILNLLDDLREQYNTSYLLISHDMGVIESVADRLAVMYLGKIVETGQIEEVFDPPYHPYTRALLTSIPSLKPEADDHRIALEGDVPSARRPPSGCSFQTRCPRKIDDVCDVEEPALEAVEGTGDTEHSHCLSCHLSESEMSAGIGTPEQDL